MGYPPRPYVNCHFCNAKLSLGLGRLSELQRPSGAMSPCQACGNEDRYEASAVRDALLMPPAEPKAAQPPLAQPEPARGLKGRLSA